MLFPCCRQLGCCPDQQASSQPGPSSRRRLGRRSFALQHARELPGATVSVSVEETSSSKSRYEQLTACLSKTNSNTGVTQAYCIKRFGQVTEGNGSPTSAPTQAAAGRRRRAQSAMTGQCEHGGRPTASTGCVIVVAGLPTVFHLHAKTCADAVTQRWGKYAATKPKVATFASAFAGGFAGIPTAALATVGAGQSFVASCPGCTWPTAFDVIAGVLALNGTTLSGHARNQGGAIMMKTGGRATVSGAIFRNNKATVGQRDQLVEYTATAGPRGGAAWEGRGSLGQHLLGWRRLVCGAVGFAAAGCWEYRVLTVIAEAYKVY